MANFKEEAANIYDWEAGGVYVIEEHDLVEGGEEGTSNRQGRELALRTRNLHDRLAVLKVEAAGIATELAALTVAVDTKAAAALRSAKEYTDAREVAVLAAADTKDANTLRSAKDYADRIVTALVDGSPEALNTLQELAAALGGDPNFATTVMQLIGERATMTQVNAALKGKADVNGDVSKVFEAKVIMAEYLNVTEKGTSNYMYMGRGSVLSNALPKNDLVIQNTSPGGSVSFISDDDPTYSKTLNPSDRRTLWHSGNFDPAAKFGVIGGGVDANAASQGSGYCYLNGSPANGTVATFNGLSINNPYGSFQIACDNQVACEARFWMRNNNQQGFTPWRELWHSGNLDASKLNALPATIIRGSVDSNGYTAGGNANNIQPLGNGMARVTHNFGHANYAVTATVNGSVNSDRNDNEVNVIAKTANYVDFVVTDGTCLDIEFAPFDFIIIPY